MSLEWVYEVSAQNTLQIHVYSSLKLPLLRIDPKHVVLGFVALNSNEIVPPGLISEKSGDQNACATYQALSIGIFKTFFFLCDFAVCPHKNIVSGD